MSQELNLINLRKVAEAATPGLWLVYDRGIGYEVHDANACELNGGMRETFDKADAEFIATFDPPTVLALLSRLEQAEAQVAKVRKLHKEYVICERDNETNSPKLDANGKQIVLARLCRACSPFDTICAAEDGHWNAGYDGTDYPCPTTRAMDGAS